MKINEDQSDYDVDGLEQSQSPSFILFSLLLSLVSLHKFSTAVCLREHCKMFDSTKIKSIGTLRSELFLLFYEKYWLILKKEGLCCLACVHRTSWNFQVMVWTIMISSWEASIHLIKYSTWMIRLTQSAASHTEKWLFSVFLVTSHSQDGFCENFHPNRFIFIDNFSWRWFELLLWGRLWYVVFGRL